MAARRRPVGGFDHYKPASGDARTLSIRVEEKGNAFPEHDIPIDSIEEFDDSENFVENILICRITPDPKNMRPSPLPRDVLQKFSSGAIDSARAAKEFLKVSQKSPLLRHTANIYINFGKNIAEHGQIKPITCKRIYVDTDKGRVEQYLLETGEQRFWAILIYGASIGEDLSKTRIRAVVAPEGTPIDEVEWVQRQISENRKTTQMTEVTQAREIARLLLAILSKQTGEDFTGSPIDENEYFRNVFKMETRIPNGVWEEIQKSMGLTPRRMRQSLSVLKLSSESLDIANRAGLSYRTLKDILGLPVEEQERRVRLAANEVIATDSEDGDREEESQYQQDVPDKDIAQKPISKIANYILAYRGIKKVSRAIRQSRDDMVIDKICDEIFADGTEAVKEVIRINDEMNKGLKQRLAGKD